MSLLDFNEFKWRAMTSAINWIKPSSSLIRDLVFGTSNSNPSEYIDVDVVIGGRKVAPFVTPIQGGVVIEKMGREMRSVRAPRIRLKKPFTANELLETRGVGRGFYAAGSGDLQSYRRNKIARELADLRNNRIENTIEWMCAQALTGTLTYNGENIAFTVDYQLPAAHQVTLTGTDLWTDTTTPSTPMDDIDDWAQLIINALGFGPDIMIVGTNVAKALRKHTTVQNLLDNRRTDLGQMTWRASSNFIGNLNGIDIYRYGTNYSDLEDADQVFWDADYIALIATRARFSIEYGAIMDLEAGASVVGEFFSKSWMEKDPSNLWILAESRPLPVPWTPEAIVYAKVT